VKKDFKLSVDRTKLAEKVMTDYPLPRAAVMPLLWLVEEQEGWVPPEAAELVADMTGVASAEVHELVSFYTLFNAKPLAVHNIQICTGPCCRLKGANKIVRHIKSKLGIGIGEITENKQFYLSAVECLGACGRHPMMRIGDKYYENLDELKVDRILEEMKT
jgi:NADH-quinone oxidoreductase subunit E